MQISQGVYELLIGEKNREYYFITLLYIDAPWLSIIKETAIENYQLSQRKKEYLHHFLNFKMNCHFNYDNR